MHPLPCGFEVDFDAVDGVDFFGGEVALHFFENAVDGGGVGEVDAVLGYEILRQGVLVLAGFQAFMGELAEE